MRKKEKLQRFKNKKRGKERIPHGACFFTDYSPKPFSWLIPPQKDLIHCNEFVFFIPCQLRLNKTFFGDELPSVMNKILPEIPRSFRKTGCVPLKKIGLVQIQRIIGVVVKNNTTIPIARLGGHIILECSSFSC